MKRSELEPKISNLVAQSSRIAQKIDKITRHIAIETFPRHSASHLKPKRFGSQSHLQQKRCKWRDANEMWLESILGEMRFDSSSFVTRRWMFCWQTQNEMRKKPKQEISLLWEYHKRKQYIHLSSNAVHHSQSLVLWRVQRKREMCDCREKVLVVCPHRLRAAGWQYSSKGKREIEHNGNDRLQNDTQNNNNTAHIKYLSCEEMKIIGLLLCLGPVSRFNSIVIVSVSLFLSFAVCVVLFGSFCLPLGSMRTIDFHHYCWNKRIDFDWHVSQKWNPNSQPRTKHIDSGYEFHLVALKKKKTQKLKRSHGIHLFSAILHVFRSKGCLFLWEINHFYSLNYTKCKLRTLPSTRCHSGRIEWKKKTNASKNAVHSSNLQINTISFDLMEWNRKETCCTMLKCAQTTVPHVIGLFATFQTQFDDFPTLISF